MTRQEFSERFIEQMELIRYEKGYTQTQMAEKLDLSTSAYKKIIAGENQKLDMYLLYRLQEMSGSPLYDVFAPGAPEIASIRLIDKLSEGQRNFIQDVIRFEAAFADNTPNSEDYITVLTPSGDMYDGMIWDSADLQKESISAGNYRAKFGKDLSCGIRITSNHLHPVYHQGDILLISRRPPRNGDIGVFIRISDGRAYLRKFYQTNPSKLVPINTYGETFTIDSNNPDDMTDWIKFGIVLTKMRSHT